jgi:hypothetical protein
MDVKTFIIFAAEVISENMNYLADADDSAEIDSTLEQNTELMEAVKRAVTLGLESAELVSLTQQLMHWNVVAWADSAEFKLHIMATDYFNEVEGVL